MSMTTIGHGGDGRMGRLADIKVLHVITAGQRRELGTNTRQ
jgi:hypothetical protein